MFDRTTNQQAPITTPLHSPLYRSTGMVDYGGDVEGFNLLLELPEDSVRNVLAPTPFDYVAPFAWVEVMLYRTLEGLAPYEVPVNDPYRCAGFSVVAAYGETIGAYCANYYKNKDFGIAPGREGAGYPVKAAEIRYQRTGRAVTATVSCPTARFEASVITGEAGGSVPAEAVNSPTLLVQQIPDVETPGGVLLRQVIARDISASSAIKSSPAEGEVNLTLAPSGTDDLRWLEGGRVIAAEFIAGPMRGTAGRVLATEYLSDGLLKRTQDFARETAAARG